jgi:peroxiredoxin
MARQYGVDYPVVLDPKGKVLGLFDVKSMPTTYLISREGIIVDKLVGWGETAVKLPKVMARVEQEL